MQRISFALLAGAIAAQLISFAPQAYGLDPHFFACLALLRLPGKSTLVAFVGGVIVYLLAAGSALGDRLDAGYAGDNILTQVRIDGFPAGRDGTVRLVAMPIDDPRLPARLRLSWRKPPAKPRGGDTWELVVRLKTPRGLLNPGGFDAEAWYFRGRMGATGYVVDSPRNRLLDTNGLDPVLRLRQSIAARVERLITDREVAAVLLAITVGARHRLSDAQWDRYARTGTSHLMAISGLHIGLAAAAAYALQLLVFTLLRIRSANHRLAIAGSLAVALAYTLLSGGGIPARRAMLMLAAGSAAMLNTRAVGALNALSLALVAVVVSAPLAVGSGGMLLSFGAVLLLVWVARQRVGNAGADGFERRLAKVALLARMQWVLLLGMLPVVLLLFARVSMAAPLINLVVVPIFSLLTVPAALAGVALGGPFDVLGDGLLALAGATIAGAERIIGLDAWPEGRHGARLGAWGVTVSILAAAWSLLPRGWPGRWISVPAVLALLSWQAERPPAGCFRLSVLDVGQGQAVLVETSNSELLYDTGPAWPGGGNVVAGTILPYLEYRSIARLSVTVLSHADLDHSGGYPALAAAIPTGRLLAGDATGIGAAAPVSCHAVRPWRRDGVRFTFLSVARSVAEPGNNRSCVLEVSAGPTRALLTGDIERPTETALAAAGLLRKASFVTIPHHGSRTSSSTALIDALRPEVAVVSAAHANRWGFPLPGIVRRWEAYATRVLTTAADGAVVATLCPDGMSRVHRERRASALIWRAP